MKVTEELLNEKNLELVDREMEEITRVTREEDRKDIPEYRAKIIEWAYEFRQRFEDCGRALHNLLCCGFVGDRVLPALRLTLQLAAAAQITPTVSAALVSCLESTGLMDASKIGAEPMVDAVLSHADFLPPPMLQQAPDRGETAGYGPPRDFAAESEKMFAERTEGKVKPPAGQEAPPIKEQFLRDYFRRLAKIFRNALKSYLAIEGARMDMEMTFGTGPAPGRDITGGELPELFERFCGNTFDRLVGKPGLPPEPEDVWRTTQRRPGEELPAPDSPVWLQDRRLVSALAEKLLVRAISLGLPNNTYRAEDIIGECFDLAAKFESRRMKGEMEANPRYTV